MKMCVFCHFPARIAKFSNVWWSLAFPNFRKVGEFAASIEHSEAKSVSASGGLRPLTSRPGDLPLDTAGGGPVIGSRSARSPCPPLPNPKYATDEVCAIDVDECYLGTANCDGEDDVCVNTRGGYKCQTVTCPRGFIKSPIIGNRSKSVCPPVDILLFILKTQLRSSVLNQPTTHW